MTLLRRTSQLIGATAIAVVAVLLVLEVTELSGGAWRRRLADGIDAVAFPEWPLWVSGLVGGGLAIAGLALIAAQFAPPKKGLNSMHEVFRSRTGDTHIRGRAAIGAARHELEQIEGVVGAAARVERTTLYVDLQVDDRANLTRVENEARARLGHEFWINLGLADFTVNLMVTHHAKPPRVR